MGGPRGSPNPEGYDIYQAGARPVDPQRDCSGRGRDQTEATSRRNGRRSLRLLREARPAYQNRLRSGSFGPLVAIRDSEGFDQDWWSRGRLNSARQKSTRSSGLSLKNTREFCSLSQYSRISLM